MVRFLLDYVYRLRAHADLREAPTCLMEMSRTRSCITSEDLG